MPKNKLIKDVDDAIWQMFAGYAKAKGRKIGELLTEVLKDYMRGRIK